MEGTGRYHELAKPRPARAAAGGEGAGLEPGEAQPPSDSSRGSRASTAGDAQCAPRPPSPRARSPRSSPRRPPRPPRGSRREGDGGQRQEGSNLSLLSHHGRGYSLARARTRTSWKAPGWTYLTGVHWGHRLLHGPAGNECAPLGSQHPPVRLSLPPRELPDPPSQQLPQLDRAVCAADSPSAKQAPAHSPVAGYPGSCSSREEGEAPR